jgi:hypothetical protein
MNLGSQAMDIDNINETENLVRGVSDRLQIFQSNVFIVEDLLI